MSPETLLVDCVDNFCILCGTPLRTFVLGPHQFTANSHKGPIHTGRRELGIGSKWTSGFWSHSLKNCQESWSSLWQQHPKRTLVCYGTEASHGWISLHLLTKTLYLGLLLFCIQHKKDTAFNKTSRMECGRECSSPLHRSWECLTHPTAIERKLGGK